VANGRLCLDYDHVRSRNVQVWSCSGKVNQKWRWESDKIVSRVDINRCIDVGGNKNLYMHACHGRKNQKFHAPKNFQCVGATIGRNGPPGRPLNRMQEEEQEM
jgi:hypothetical protein